MYSVRNTVPIIFGILILTGASGFQFAPIVQTAEAEPTKRIVGYFPYWESGDINSIDYTKLTDVIYFHIWPNADGTLDTSAININDLNTIRDNAHMAGVNVLIAVGGWGVSDGFPTMVEDEVARANFLSNVANFISTNNLDGVDIDWETPIDSDKIDNQDVLLTDLSELLHPMGKLVTVAANGEAVELKASAANSVDWVNVMAYDMNWGNAEHSTFTDSVSALQNYEAVGIPKEKLSLGIPFYGRNDQTQAMKYEDLVSACNPLPSSNSCNGYFFNGIDLVQQKSQFVLDNGYDGVMIWNLGQDTYDQTSLLNAIFEIFENEPLPDLPPLAVDDSYAVDAQSILTIASPGVLSNDSDPNGDPITAVIDTNVSNGILTLNPNGSFSYSPNSDFEGIDSFTYHVDDFVNSSNTATVTITVNPTNSIHLENMEITKSGNKRWTATVTITVFDENNNAISDVTSIGSWSGGSSGTATCVSDLSGKCDVSKSTKGDNLTFTIEDISGVGVSYDSNLNKVSDSITINKDGTILGQNNPPTANPGGPYTGFTGELVIFDGSESTDPEGDSLTYLWDFGDGNTKNGVTPSHTYSSDGTYDVTLEVTDSQGAVDSSSTTVVISTQNSSNLTITQISPNSMIKGQTTSLIISGTDFGQNAIVNFDGAKWAPSVISTLIIDSTTIQIDVTRSSAGPSRDFVYDLTVTNSDGDSFTLPESFTVTSQ